MVLTVPSLSFSKYSKISILGYEYTFSWFSGNNSVTLRENAKQGTESLKLSLSK